MRRFLRLSLRRFRIGNRKSEIGKGLKRFEEMPVWQEAKGLVTEIYKTSNGADFSRNFGLRDQSRRASVSIMSSIAEGFERETDKEFIRFLYSAKASAAEIRSQLYVALNLNYIDEQACAHIQQKAETISKQISGFIKYLSRTRTH